MAKAKYTRDKQGYFSTNVFDGTYDDYGRKHYKRIRSRKSSADLEKMVQEFGALVKTGKVSKKTEKNKKLKKEKDDILSSNSWKLTSPLRKIKNIK